MNNLAEHLGSPVLRKTEARECAAAICDVVLHRLNVSMAAQIHLLKQGKTVPPVVEAVYHVLRNLRTETIEELVRQFDGERGAAQVGPRW